MTDGISKPVAVVTGAAGDIGTAVAARLTSTHKVAAVDIDRQALDQTVSRLRKNGGHVAAVECDITNPDDLSRIKEEVTALGAVNLLVNNAGGARSLSLRSMSSKSLSHDLALNLEAALNCFKAFEHSLVSSGDGNVVNIASINGLATLGHPAYSAAKAGLIHATKAIAVEFGLHGLRANAIAPGTVKTQAWKDRAAATPHVFDEALNWYPYKLLPEPDDIAAEMRSHHPPGCLLQKAKLLMEDKGLGDTMELQAYFMGKMRGILKKLGKKLAGWDEVSHGGGIDPDGVLLMAWQKQIAGPYSLQAGINATG